MHRCTHAHLEKCLDLLYASRSTSITLYCGLVHVKTIPCEQSRNADFPNQWRALSSRRSQQRSAGRFRKVPEEVWRNPADYSPDPELFRCLSTHLKAEMSLLLRTGAPGLLGDGQPPSPSHLSASSVVLSLGCTGPGINFRRSQAGPGPGLLYYFKAALVISTCTEGGGPCGREQVRLPVPCFAGG